MDFFVVLGGVCGVIGGSDDFNYSGEHGGGSGVCCISLGILKFIWKVRTISYLKTL